MTMSSEILELEYLRAATPAEVLRYLDAKSATFKVKFLDRCISEEIEKMLLSRNDRTVDLGLARACDHDGASLLIDRYSTLGTNSEVVTIDDSVIFALLTNKSAINDMLSRYPNWLRRCIGWVSEKGGQVHLKALFTNPEIGNEVVDDVLNRNGPYKSMASDQYGEVLRYALESKPVVDGPDEDSYEYDLTGNQTLTYVWSMLVHIETENQLIANVIANAIDKFKAISVSYSDHEVLGISKENDDKNYPLQKIKYLDYVLSRWNNEKTGKATSKYHDERDSHRKIREIAASKCFLYSEVKTYLLSHDDIYARRGYYRGLSEATLEELESYYDRDKIAFCEAAVYNKFFYDRANVKVAKWFYSKISLCPYPENEWDESPHQVFNQMANKLSIEQPGRYFPNGWSISDSNEVSDIKNRNFQKSISLENTKTGSAPEREIALALWNARRIVEDSKLLGAYNPETEDYDFTVQQGLRAASHGREDAAATLWLLTYLHKRVWWILIGVQMCVGALAVMAYKLF